MRYSNLHTHTTFSDGKHSVEENVLSALEKNMLSIGFSDHSFTACDPSYCMFREKYEDYRSAVLAMKVKYKDRIPVYLGMELDYYSDIDRDQYDYLIASVHYIVKDGVCYPIDHSPEQQIDCRDNAFGGDMMAVAKCYYDMVVEHVEKTRPTFVGHFDVITKFSQMPEEDESYRQMAREALRRVIKTCPYIEVNTGAISRGWRTVPYPNQYLLETLREAGGEPVLGSDSHHRDNLIFHFDETVEMLKQAGFDHVCVFNGKDFDKVYFE